MSRCQVIGERPQVWKDDDGWRCDQAVMCLTCSGVWQRSLAEGVSWTAALAAAYSRGERLRYTTGAAVGADPSEATTRD